MPTRAQQLQQLASSTFDVLVIGGGITGAGIARDAASRGLAVALIDKDDFASGTSSRSSRLIHGGVRYLEHGYFHLVFEASAERRRLLALAPQLVRPLPFVWPVYRGQRLALWKLSAGLTLYDLLAMFRNVERHRRLRPAQVLDKEPRLNPRQLLGGVRYFDAATNDARLTLANVLDATRLGAVAANHVAFVGIDQSRTDLRIARVEDTLSGQRLEVRARVLVNATGPWSDTVRQFEDTVGRPRTKGSKGAHIAISRDRVGNHDAVTLLHPKDGRVMFALPAGPNAIIGTTDTFTDASPDNVRANERDIAYLLDAANAFFPDALLHREDVVAAWAGIRPLLPSEGTSVQASREHAIERSNGMVTITGGKLTTYRVMATDVVNVVQLALGMRPSRAGIRHRPLVDREEPPPPDAEVVPGLPYQRSEIRYAVEREMACTLGDMLIRRTRVAFETRDNGRSAARGIIGDVSSLLGWDAVRQAKELERYDAEAARIFTIDP
ncbi:MAG TPA: glycerol-3-phosphate dehydrogenase/oxidase [Gemmatimonadaceae bacterium]|nr:glycerol-3-phosphate dehydrogenase/oxidase [Gemmatimonadaceae bacterium]